MSVSETDTKASRKRPPFVLFITPLLVGLLGFYRVTQSPQFEAYRTVDLIQLGGSGACLGATLVGLMVILLRPRT